MLDTEKQRYNLYYQSNQTETSMVQVDDSSKLLFDLRKGTDYSLRVSACKNCTENGSNTCLESEKSKVFSLGMWNSNVYLK